MQTHLQDIARAHLETHGLLEDIVGMVRMWQAEEEADPQGRTNISIGYVDGNGRRKELSMASLPSADDAVNMLEDRDRIGALICLGILAMPAASRPDMPSWMTESHEVRKIRSGMRRASVLADQASRGNLSTDAETTGENTPF